jgi:hypothetical protein
MARDINTEEYLLRPEPWFLDQNYKGFQRFFSEMNRIGYTSINTGIMIELYNHIIYRELLG